MRIINVTAEGKIITDGKPLSTADVAAIKQGATLISGNPAIKVVRDTAPTRRQGSFTAEQLNQQRAKARKAAENYADRLNRSRKDK
jgi:energy-coupling factor transporter ATP-binding protein EcfA2